MPKAALAIAFSLIFMKTAAGCIPPGSGCQKIAKNGQGNPVKGHGPGKALIPSSRLMGISYWVSKKNKGTHFVIDLGCDEGKITRVVLRNSFGPRGGAARGWE